MCAAMTIERAGVAVAEVRGAPRSGPAAPALRKDAAASQGPTELCEVCCEMQPAKGMAGCGGCAHRYCVTCLRTYWEGAIFSGNHVRLLCMYGGCGVAASDEDVRAVVQGRSYRKMLFFRSRDLWAHNPAARWCASDGCWALVADRAPQDTRSPLVCPRCSAGVCYKCEQSVELGANASPHDCAARRARKTHGIMFEMWATVHTKACPACACRIQRNHGCSHMTCTRCAAYWCWRCKGFLNNGCPLPGRPCVCDRVMAGAAYSGLVVATVVGSPFILTAAVLGGGPYLLYRMVKTNNVRRRRRRRDSRRGDIENADHNDIVADTRVQYSGYHSASGSSGEMRPLRRNRRVQSWADTEQASGRMDELAIARAALVASSGTLSPGGADSDDEDVNDDATPAVHVEAWAARPFVLERRSGGARAGSSSAGSRFALHEHLCLPDE